MSSMSNLVKEFDCRGYLVVDGLVSAAEVDAIENELLNCATSTAGTRNLLNQRWCGALADRIKNHPGLAPCMPNNFVAVQCTFFDKSEDKNWLVATHRDELIPVKEKINAIDWDLWSVKEGTNFVRPPRSVLEKLVVIRLAIDSNNHLNGPLQIVPGSHKAGSSSTNRISCHVDRGGALVLKPLLLHSSGKVKRGRRRVLHYLFGPKSLPNGSEWAFSI